MGWIPGVEQVGGRGGRRHVLAHHLLATWPSGVDTPRLALDAALYLYASGTPAYLIALIYAFILHLAHIILARSMADVFKKF